MTEETIVTVVAMAFSAVGTFVLTNAEKWREKYFDSRRIRREAIGRALSVLLDVHHHAAVYRDLNELFSLGGALVAKAAVMQMARKILPDLTPLTKDYEESIKSLAGEDPALASKIRDAHRYLDICHQTLTMVADDAPEPDTQRLVDGFSTIMHAEVFKSIDAKVEELASMHSKKTKADVKALRENRAQTKWELAMELEAKILALELPKDQRDELDQLFTVWRKNQPSLAGGNTPRPILSARSLGTREDL